ncbi:FAD-dependent oxidoreductase [Eubacteriaceae bacterium ES2]|nr:FAD-dependent oxidoreductase [Eubacteriaceae bacterium ES2]
MEDAGVDAFDIDSGSYENIDYIFPPAYLGDACMSDVCELTRKATSKPLLNAGNHTPETGLSLIESGHADFVLMGRPLIAEPFMAKKLLKDQRDQVRPCIRCNEDCIGRIINRLTKISCSVNPTTGFEKRFQLEKTSNPKNVVVVGGGPGGMEAACTAASIGHSVTLFEAAKELGGQLRCAATPDFKSQLKALVSWYKGQLKLREVDVKLNAKVTADHPALAAADEIIVATGAEPIRINMKGFENTIDILTAHMDESALKGDHIIYCGGGLSACDSAIETAMKGKQVTIIEMLDEVAAGDHFINKAALLPMLAENNVQLYTGHRILEILPKGVKAQQKDGTEVIIEGSTIVASFGMVPKTDAAKEIDAKYHAKSRLIGDCGKVGKVGGAIRTGFYAAISID